MNIIKYIFALLCVMSIPAFGMEESMNASDIYEMFKNIEENIASEQDVVEIINRSYINSDTILDISHLTAYIKCDWFTDTVIKALKNKGCVFNRDMHEKELRQFTYFTEKNSGTAIVLPHRETVAYQEKIAKMFDKSCFQDVFIEDEPADVSDSHSDTDEKEAEENGSDKGQNPNNAGNDPKQPDSLSKPSHLKYWIGGSIAACTAVIIGAIIYMKMQQPNNEQQEQIVQ